MEFLDFPRNIVYKWRVFAHRFLDLLDEAWAEMGLHRDDKKKCVR